MKKSLFPICAPLCAAALLFCSCSEVTTEIVAQPRDFSEEQMYKVSNNDILALLKKNNLLKTKGEPADFTMDPYLWEGDTVMFLVNDASGWQLISADKRACPIVVYEDGEHKTLKDIMGSPILGGWISSVAKDIHTLKNGNYRIENENTKYWNYVEGKASMAKTKSPGLGWKLICTIDISSTSMVVDHIIPTKWGDCSPWNSCFPNDNDGQPLDVGSHNVAIAQMLYWSHQQNGIPIYAYTDITAVTGHMYLDEDENYQYYLLYPVFSFIDSSSVAWSQMKTTSSGSGNSDYVGYLMAKVRSLTNPFYAEDYSPATDIAAINYFQLDASTNNYVADTVINHILQGEPSLIIANVQSGSSNNNIACIADYYYSFSNTYEEFYIYDPYDTYSGIIDIDLEYATPEDIILVLPDGYEWCSEQHAVSMRYISFNWGLNGIGDNQRYSVNSTLWDWVHYSVTTTVSPWKMIYNIHTTN